MHTRANLDLTWRSRHWPDRWLGFFPSCCFRLHFWNSVWLTSKSRLQQIIVWSLSLDVFLRSQPHCTHCRNTFLAHLVESSAFQVLRLIHVITLPLFDHSPTWAMLDFSGWRNDGWSVTGPRLLHWLKKLVLFLITPWVFADVERDLSYPGQAAMAMFSRLGLSWHV